MAKDTSDNPTLRTAPDLAAVGLIAPDQVSALALVGERYAIAVSPAMKALVDPADASDPIARQFVPDVRELQTQPEESDDPIGDHLKSPVPGLVHRYPDRVLVKLTGLCPVYCRFCFRREMVGPDNAENLTAAQLDAAMAYIRGHPQIWEVILTGGDPLILSPRRIREVTTALASIPHVKVLRWHTRVPVVTPERVTDELIEALTSADVAVTIGIHANHPRELTLEARAVLKRLQRAGILMVSQSVLLAGVNDDTGTLESLMRAFVEAGVKPYYLHHPDRAPGTSHFRIGIARGQALLAELRRRISGIAMPTYVLDIPGAHGKVPIEVAHVREGSGPGEWFIADRQGNEHAYEDIL